MNEKYTYNILTIGCQMNKSDSERAAAVLEKLGFQFSDNKYRADLVVVNTCGVRQSAEDRIYGLIPRIKKENPQAKIILTGCLVNRGDVKRRLKNYVDVWLPITEITNYELSRNCGTPSRRWRITNKFQSLKSKCQNNYLSIKPKYQSKNSAFVPIGNGCNNFCSYCVVPYARGREVWRPAEEIISEVQELVKGGYKEITLIAQNVNSYKSPRPPLNLPLSKGEEKGADFADLLRMVDNIPGDFWIKFVTSHPKDMSGELIKAMAKCKKVAPSIHLPIQSGDNEILKKMNRNYTAGHYKKFIAQIRQEFNKNKYILNRREWHPPVAITTDIIVGFPGETKKQFNNTVKLFKQIKFDMAYIAHYSPRPGTRAFKLNDNVSKPEKKRREKELLKILRRTALENNKKYIGKTLKVLVEKRSVAGLYGKSSTGKNVKINHKLPITNFISKFIKVKITGVKNFSLAGEPIK